MLSNISKILWPIVVIIALFLFRAPIEYMLFNAEELNVLGVNVRAKKEDVVKLENKVNEYKVQIGQLESSLKELKANINPLNSLNNKLKKSVEKCKCPEVKTDLNSFGKNIDDIKKLDTKIKSQVDYFSNVQILNRNINIVTP